MMAVADVGAPVSPLLVAAVLLLGREYCHAHALPRSTVEQILTATSASRSRAYELRDALRDVLPSLLRPVGRPPVPPRETAPDAAYALLGAVTTFVMDHPGCVYGGPERRRYDDAFRRFLLELREQHPDLDLDAFADAVRVPLGTLKEWLNGRPAPKAEPSVDDHPPDEDADAGDASASSTTPESAQIQVVLSCWKTWKGSFGDFYKHVRTEQRLSLGRSLIAQILFVHAGRRPQRRGGRSPDERALLHAFETFFPGAQWVGDGSPIAVSINQQRFVFNLELMVDSHTGGFAGMSLRDEEDAAAVTEAVRDGIATTGKAPFSVLLDNRPSNHTAEVDAALGDETMRMRATPGRPQNKAHCEGAFGLFRQTAPALELHGGGPRELARQFLTVVVQTWARTLNHRPRADRGGFSRVGLYNLPISTEQIDKARAALQERCRKQQLTRINASARMNPLVRTLLDEAFARLGLADPEGHLRAAIARYGVNAVVDGIALFEARHRNNTLPLGIDARYLLGIVRNLGEAEEGVAIADQMLRARLDARDRMLVPLALARDAARSDTPDLQGRVLRFIDLALAAERGVDRSFWLLAAADEINTLVGADLAALAAVVARRIHATHRVTYRERTDAVRVLFGKVIPLG
jgi:hypothetical protein